MKCYQLFLFMVIMSFGIPLVIRLSTIYKLAMIENRFSDLECGYFDYSRAAIQMQKANQKESSVFQNQTFNQRQIHRIESII